MEVEGAEELTRVEEVVPLQEKSVEAMVQEVGVDVREGRKINATPLQFV